MAQAGEGGAVMFVSTNTVYHADAVDFVHALPDDSVDLIFTDPPYMRSFLWAYGWLAEAAARVLRPGGWLLAMGGGMYADEIIPEMSAHLTWHYMLFVQLTGSASGKWRPHGQTTPVIPRVKPIYALAKGRSKPRTVVYTPFEGDGNDKRFHHWGQDMKSARYYIDCFSAPGDVVLDPFVGGGTTAVVCQALGRDFLACDVDRDAVDVTRGRLSNPLYMPAQDGQLRFDFVKEATV